jgi:D-alanyl-D-alanine dipeptidase
MKSSKLTLVLCLILIPFHICSFARTRASGVSSTDETARYNKTLKSLDLTAIDFKLIGLGLINVQDSIPEILVDLKYASEDNFVGINFYKDLQNAYMQYECMIKLKTAFDILQEEKPNYTFLIYDAARSIQSQQLMWDALNVPEWQKFWYVADPQRGSMHNYGMAIDVTIVDDNENILDMGTKFDYFGELAYPRYSEYFYSIGKLTQEQYQNRILLMDIMERAGFYVSKTEWWHYNATSLDDAKQKYEIFSLN